MDNQTRADVQREHAEPVDPWRRAFVAAEAKWNGAQTASAQAADSTVARISALLELSADGFDEAVFAWYSDVGAAAVRSAIDDATDDVERMLAAASALSGLGGIGDALGWVLERRSVPREFTFLVFAEEAARAEALERAARKLQHSASGSGAIAHLRAAVRRAGLDASTDPVGEASERSAFAVVLEEGLTMSGDGVDGWTLRSPPAKLAASIEIPRGWGPFRPVVDEGCPTNAMPAAQFLYQLPTGWMLEFGFGIEHARNTDGPLERLALHARPKPPAELGETLRAWRAAWREYRDSRPAAQAPSEAPAGPWIGSNAVRRILKRKRSKAEAESWIRAMRAKAGDDQVRLGRVWFPVAWVLAYAHGRALADELAALKAVEPVERIPKPRPKGKKREGKGREGQFSRARP